MIAPKPAILVLSSGLSLRGKLIGRPGSAAGKMVFNTSMTGYQEILTDPSYAGEIITFTFPPIGIYGATAQDSQSGRIHARGLVVGELSTSADNWRSSYTLADMLLRHSITGISGIDTRALAIHIREHGEMLGVITSELSEEEARRHLEQQPDFGAQDFVLQVTCQEPYIYEAGKQSRPMWPELAHAAGSSLFASSEVAQSPEHFVVSAYDFGIKRGILDCLSERGCTTHVFPATSTVEDLLAVSPDGVFLSNGPGDPARMDYVLPHIQRLLELARDGGPETSGRRLPLFGICLGHQLMARAAGLPTYRLKFGNRGANHPVLDLKSGRAHITSQNHSYAVALDCGAYGEPSAAPVQELAGCTVPKQQSDRQPAEVAGRKPIGTAVMEDGHDSEWIALDGRPRGVYRHPLNSDVLVAQININDRSLEGLAWAGEDGNPLAAWPAFSVQYHPEGCPGPRDSTYLFDEFVRLMRDQRSAKDTSG